MAYERLPAFASGETPVSPEAVRSELQRILASPEFNASKRCQSFLHYVVEQALAGTVHGIKERTVGVEAFGRPADYDTTSDGIVRIKASEVRKRLSLYYAGAGKGSEVLISLPSGSYTPVFAKGVSEETTVAEPSLPYAPPGNRSLKSGPRHLSWAAALCLLLSVVAVAFASWRSYGHHLDSALNQFWHPLLSGATPILLATAYAPVYLPPPNAEASLGKFALLSDQYTGGGDLVAAVEVASMFTRVGRSFNLRMGTAGSFDDLRNTPTVLIGYSSTQWADVTKNFRYFIDDEDRGVIRDYGRTTAWFPRNRTDDYHTREDYAIISRAFVPQTHSMMVLITGCTQYGTEGAARLITNAELFGKALASLPPGWQAKNLQFVLHVDVIANSPASARVVAAHAW